MESALTLDNVEPIIIKVEGEQEVSLTPVVEPEPEQPPEEEQI